MTALSRIWALLTPPERRRALLVLLAAAAMALVDTAGVASVMPFLAVLGNPALVESNAILAGLYKFGGFADREAFLFALGIAALAAVLASALVRAAGQYAIFAFANMRRYSLSRRLIDGYLARPYGFFLDRNSADLTKRALSDVDTVVDNCLIPVLQMVAYGLVVVMLIALLVAADPALATLVIAAVGGFYAAIYAMSRRLLTRLGRERSEANRERFTVAAEAFGGIKELKLFGEEQSFAVRFAMPALAFARHKATADTLGRVPRYLVEAFAFGGALALALVLVGRRGDLGAVLPILGLYAFAGYRLLPAVQNFYMGLIDLRFHLPMVEAILADLPAADLSCHPGRSETRSVALQTRDPGTSDRAVVLGPGSHSPADAGSFGRDDNEGGGERERLPLRESIRFDRVTFRYPGATRPVLSALDLEIRAGTTVGLVGPTGAGKTTAVDLLLGLLEPTDGRILIDGAPLSAANRRAWQRALGYVPQEIFLADGTVAENIAFGAAPEAIDHAAVERAAKIANLHEFVVRELPQGYATVIGERGARLSGGQRQRIGIARALYRDPALLVFDEATSALDMATEAAVMEAVGKLRGQKTMVVIAHRESGVRACDWVFTFEKGRASWPALSRTG